MQLEEKIGHVKRCAVILDQREPNWATIVNADTLNLWNNSYCVLGQLYGSFRTRAARLTYYACGRSAGIFCPYRHRQEITAAWRHEIQIRQQPELKPAQPLYFPADWAASVKDAARDCR